MEPVALAMAAAWGAWARRQGYSLRAENLGRKTAYAGRMRLFEHLGIPFDAGLEEKEAAGRFVPLTQVTSSIHVRRVIADISALLHLQEDPETLSAVQYCVSELLRNVLEHSGSEDGAFVCAHRYTTSEPHRVTIAVADCGQGIASHLGRVYPAASSDDVAALGLAMRPGITGAVAGLYGTPDNAGAGLFITRSIAKGSGGYFFLMSGNAAYRLRRAKTDDEMTELIPDAYDEPRHDRYVFDIPWKGTVVSAEIRTEKIHDYNGFFQWIFRSVPRRETRRRRIRFT
ncbi:MAG TPA: ATP-binding protein [Thermoanaerobaculia bacterium]|nr:ATP-binding protein [Thermoanaerobaculia bacterium]